MSAGLRRITQDSFGSLLPRAVSSVFWELEPDSAARVRQRGEERFEKEAWLSSVLLDSPGCGFYMWEERPLATLFYCAPAQAPGAAQLPTAPVSADAMLITSLHVAPGWEGMGMEAVLIDAAIMDMVTEDTAPAVEAFGLRAEEAADPLLSQVEEMGIIGAEALEAAGFHVVSDHPVFPRLRLELPPERELLVAWEAQPLRAHA
ncbi:MULTISPECIES: hypothetical protein [unclassified Corynebacterium]|uniref:hypothetical protein n=1 Tax=unclassified Corynebacterium TaxID=2624378 RepID=UPI0029CA0347|nr:MULTISPECIES: hypothetical protein [unclassified Corynebacterium]WPF66154.1 hypothetical protein OLX12_11505 [Corynebacterium sp. 22KM0430]WPF68646.1 hypothetical protein OLW90_11505 [Corynebacterium sp. 21KM1197]